MNEKLVLAIKWIKTNWKKYSLLLNEGKMNNIFYCYEKTEKNGWKYIPGYNMNGKFFHVIKWFQKFFLVIKEFF